MYCSGLGCLYLKLYFGQINKKNEGSLLKRQLNTEGSIFDHSQDFASGDVDHGRHCAIIKIADTFSVCRFWESIIFGKISGNFMECKILIPVGKVIDISVLRSV